MTLQDLLALGFQQTPEGKLFLPWSKTDFYNSVFPSDNEGYIGWGKDESGNYTNQIQQRYPTLEEAFASQAGTRASLGNNQNAFYLPADAAQGSYNDQLGYTFDPSGLSYGPINYATGSGWNSFRDEFIKPSLTLYAASQLPSLLGGDAGAVDYGAGEGNYAAYDAAGGNAAYGAGYETVGGSSGTENLIGGSGSDTLANESIYGDPSLVSEPTATDVGFWDTLKGYGSDLLNFFDTKPGDKLLGAGLGALLGSMNKSKQAGTTTKTESNVADWQKPYVEAALADASRIYDTIPGGIDPLTASGRDYFGNVIAGNYLLNPYEQAAADAAAADAANAVASKFSLAGRYGSPGMAEATARGVASAVAPYRYGTYNNERTRQQAAAALAPDYSQAYLTQPFLKSSAYLGLIGKPYGRTVSEPYFENRVGSMLGGALLGSQIFR